jgi:ATP-binding cassette subfamily D (ALD) protein 2
MEITTFVAGVAHLYSHVSKPLLDASLITFSLFRLSRDQQSNTSAGRLSNKTHIVVMGDLAMKLVSSAGKFRNTIVILCGSAIV